MECKFGARLPVKKNSLWQITKLSSGNIFEDLVFHRRPFVFQDAVVNGIAPDTIRHPHDRLAAVVQRVMDSYISGADWSAACPACGCLRLETEPCTRCGVAPPDLAIALPANLRHRIASQWRHIWHRTAYVDQLDRQASSGTDSSSMRWD